MSALQPPNEGFVMGESPPVVPVVPVDNSLHMSIPKGILKWGAVLLVLTGLVYGVHHEWEKIFSPPTVTMPKIVTGETGCPIKIEAVTDASALVFHSPDPNLSITDRRLFGNNISTTIVTTDVPGNYTVYAVAAKHGYISDEIPVQVAVTKRKPKPGPGPQPPPEPPPTPVPPPGPGPQPPPTPTPSGTGAWVIIVKDDAGSTTPAEAKILDSETMIGYLTSGKARIYASGADAAKISAKGYDKLMASKKVSAPALIVLDKAGKCVAAETLPTDEPTLKGKLTGLMGP